MSTIKVTDKRNVFSTEITGTNVKLVGQVTLDKDNVIKEANGDIRLAETNMGETYIGYYSLYGVNVNNDAYIKYRTEASQLLDELTAAINNGTMAEEGGEA